MGAGHARRPCAPEMCCRKWGVNMKHLNARVRTMASWLLTALCLTVLAGCASHPDRIRPGMARDEVLHVFGPPAGQRQVPGGEVLVYSTAPMGFYAYAARIGADQRVQAVEQVLTFENFGRAKVDEWTMTMVQGEYGRPAEIRTLHNGETWWSYRYKQNDMWHMMMTYFFDARGVLRKVQNTIDPMYDLGDARISRWR